jgi:hypothetical protein
MALRPRLWPGVPVGGMAPGTLNPGPGTGAVKALLEDALPAGRAQARGRAWLSRHFDFDQVAFDDDLVRWHTLRCGRAYDVPCRHVKPRAVPGTGDHQAVKLAFAQGTAPMSARPVDRVDGAAHVEQRHRPAPRIHLAAGARREVGQCRYFD